MAKRLNSKYVKETAHDLNNRVQWGWSHWISPYISMLSVVSIIEILIAKLFPQSIVNGTILNFILLLLILYASYWFGKHHEDYEREEARRRRLRRR